MSTNYVIHTSHEDTTVSVFEDLVDWVDDQGDTFGNEEADWSTFSSFLTSLDQQTFTVAPGEGVEEKFLEKIHEHLPSGWCAIANPSNAQGNTWDTAAEQPRYGHPTTCGTNKKVKVAKNGDNFRAASIQWYPPA